MLPHRNTTPRFHKRKCMWPAQEELEILLQEMPVTQIAKKFGVSDNAVRRWAKKYKLDTPPRGFWTGK